MDNKSKIIQNLNILENLILNLTNNLDSKIIKHYNQFLCLIFFLVVQQQP